MITIQDTRVLTFWVKWKSTPQPSHMYHVRILFVTAIAAFSCESACFKSLIVFSLLRSRWSPLKDLLRDLEIDCQSFVKKWIKTASDCLILTISPLCIQLREWWECFKIMSIDIMRMIKSTGCIWREYLQLPKTFYKNATISQSWSVVSSCRDLDHRVSSPSQMRFLTQSLR